MGRAIAAIGALLIAALFLYSGNGLQGTLLAVRGASEGFSNVTIGLLMSSYFVGFIIGSWAGPQLVSSVGHIRVFTALASIASAAALAHALVVVPAAWLLLRIVTGFCFAGLAMVVESWINEKATKENRGQVLSIYRIVDLSGLTIGQAMLILAPPERFDLFALISILISLALVPVALTRSAHPLPVPRVRIDLKALFQTSPVAAVGSLLVGLANTCFWAMGPVFMTRQGYDLDAVSLFMGVAIIGALVVQWPLGWISDKMDRRLTLLFCTVGVVLTSGYLIAITGIKFTAFALPASHQSGLPELMIAAACYGAAAIPCFGLCIAHANDLIKQGEYVQINSGLLMLYGIGSISGPLCAAFVMDTTGPAGLYIVIGGTYAVLSVSILLRLIVRSPAYQPEKDKFAPVSARSVAGFEMNPSVTPREIDAQ